jgi:DNA (cytosine-5)-methyltransferase 1
MRYLSVCSGVEAATVAWHGLGWQPVAFSEIEKFPSQVLAHHYPDVPNLGDMTKYKEWDFGTTGLDLLVGGTPCQSFSVAGLRKGIEDPRGNLALVYCGILDKFRPKWFVWENVPGVLSSGGGRDFGSLLGAMAELGYSCAYRVLDAQYFGVPQRRKRVFIVGHLGDWRNPAKVLFESDSLLRDTKKVRKTRQEPTSSAIPSVANCIQTTCHDYSRADGFNMIAFENSRRDGVRLYNDKTNTLQAFAGTGGGNGPCVAIQGNMIGRDKGGPNGVGASQDGSMYTLTKTDVHAVAHAWKMRYGKEGGGKGYLGSDELAFTLNTQQDQQVAVAVDTYNLTEATDGTTQTVRGMGSIDHVGGVVQKMAVRRLTPKECERLQGFPDDYTNIKDKCPDGPRYKAMGNSMAVPVMQWIGKRIQMVEDGLL